MDRETIIAKILEQNALYRDTLRTHPLLQYLFFEVTTRCNLSCLHCGSSCKVHNGIDMPPEYIEKALASVAAHMSPNDLMLCITGGEPLLYPHLLSAMDAAAKRGFRWGMTTNATLIDDAKAQSLYQAGLVSTTVSIDGLGSSHDWFRNTPGSFRMAKKGMDALVKNAPDYARVDILTVVNKRNLRELDEIYQFALDSGARSWRLVNMEPIGRARHNDQYMLSPEEFRILLDYIQGKHFSATKLDVDFGCSHYLTLEYERMLRPYSFMCMAGLQVASIACNGDMIACLDIERRPELVQGNIRTADFWQVWTEKYRFFRTDRTEASEQCRHCPERHLCAGDSAHTWNFQKNQPYLCMRELLATKNEGETISHG